MESLFVYNYEEGKERRENRWLPCCANPYYSRNKPTIPINVYPTILQQQQEWIRSVLLPPGPCQFITSSIYHLKGQGYDLNSFERLQYHVSFGLSIGQLTHHIHFLTFNRSRLRGTGIFSLS